MPKAKIDIGTPTTPNWVELDAKNADTLGGKTLEEVQASASVPLIDSNTSTSKTSPPTADALRVTTELIDTKTLESKNEAQTYADVKDTTHALDFIAHNLFTNNVTTTNNVLGAANSYNIHIDVPSSSHVPATIPDGFGVTFVPPSTNASTSPLIRLHFRYPSNEMQVTVDMPDITLRKNRTTTFAAGTIKTTAPLSIIKVGNYFLARNAGDPSDGLTAVAADLASGKTAAVNGNVITGTVPVRTGGTITSNQTLAAGIYDSDIIIGVVSKVFPGGNKVYTQNTQVTSSSTSPIKLKSCVVRVPGRYEIGTMVWSSNTSVIAYVQFRKNGVLMSQQSTNTTSGVSALYHMTEDAEIGDTLELWGSTSASNWAMYTNSFHVGVGVENKTYITAT